MIPYLPQLNFPGYSLETPGNKVVDIDISDSD